MSPVQIASGGMRRIASVGSTVVPLPAPSRAISLRPRLQAVLGDDARYAGGVAAVRGHGPALPRSNRLAVLIPARNRDQPAHSQTILLPAASSRASALRLNDPDLFLAAIEGNCRESPGELGGSTEIGPP